MADAYTEFLQAKAVQAPPAGFEPRALPSTLKPFQADLTSWAIRRGRAALFEGTGLGKTFQELVWARQVQEETRRPVLVFAPLAVAEQTVREAEKFDIDGVAYAAEQVDARTPIVVTNYDRLHLFDIASFGGVVLGESSILKAQDGKTRQALTEACETVPFRLCETATPAPNDWTDISQSDVLSHRAARAVEDERHISPLQLTVIRRCLQLWSNPGDVVFSPFAGIGSELYVAVQMGRRGLGAELKESYFSQAVANLEAAQREAPRTLFDVEAA